MGDSRRRKMVLEFVEPQVDENTGKYPYCLDCPEHCASCPEPLMSDSERAGICELTEYSCVFPDTTDSAPELTSVQLKLDFDC
jgi:hypothetical protein